MVSGHAVICHWGSGDKSNSEKQYQLAPLQVAEIAANAYGFVDLDVEPTDKGWKITATGKNRQLTVTGATIDKAVENLLEKFE